MPYDLRRKIIENMSRVHVRNENSIEILMDSLTADGRMLPADEIKPLARPVFAYRPTLREKVRLRGRSREKVVGEILDAVSVFAAET